MLLEIPKVIFEKNERELLLSQNILVCKCGFSKLFKVIKSIFMKMLVDCGMFPIVVLAEQNWLHFAQIPGML